MTFTILSGTWSSVSTSGGSSTRSSSSVMNSTFHWSAARCGCEVKRAELIQTCSFSSVDRCTLQTMQWTALRNVLKHMLSQTAWHCLKLADYFIAIFAGFKSCRFHMLRQNGSDMQAVSLLLVGNQWVMTLFWCLKPTTSYQTANDSAFSQTSIICSLAEKHYACTNQQCYSQLTDEHWVMLQ